MFVANNQRGDMISLIGHTWDSALHLKNEGPYFCPACCEPVILKAGRKKLPHFAHIQRCPVKPEGESLRHLSGKKALFNWFARHGFKPQLEHYIPEIRQRPDLLFYVDHRPVAVEFQVSMIPVDLLIKRTKTYVADGIFPLWILDDTILRVKHPGILALSDFLAFFIQTVPFGKPAIYTFNADKQMMTVYTNIFPYSPQRAFFDRKQFPVHTPVKTVFAWQRPPVNFYDRWLEALENWLAGLIVSPKARKNPFLQYLYMNRIHPLQLPPEVGLPVQNLHVIKTPPFIWQGYIWHHFLYKKGRGYAFTLQKVHQFLYATVPYIVKKRMTASNWQNPRERSPVEHYLQMLCKLGYLAGTAGHFTVTKEVNLIKNPNRNRFPFMNDFYRRYKGKIVRSLLLTK